jgi:SAM-dependent methyltransferase
MNETHRATARQLAQQHLEAGDPLGWFEDLYSLASGDPSIIPWADLRPNPNLVDWLDQQHVVGPGKALKVGCGVGDDAEELARRGFETTAFDISQTAIAWSRRRFPRSPVSYLVADLLSAPAEWEARFDLVLESYTLQVLPAHLRTDAMRCITSFVAPAGTLLVITRGREPNEPEGNMPWPLTRDELAFFETLGLREACFEDYLDHEAPPVRRFRATYGRDSLSSGW